MTTSTIRPEIEALEKLFGRINEKFFNNEIEHPIITIAPARNTAAGYISMGHCTVNRVWKDRECGADDGAYEINVSAETLHMPLSEIVDTIAHEACHLSNLLKGIQDCSRGGTYHNKKFRDEAIRCGMDVTYSEKYGWNETKPGAGLLAFVAEQSDIELALARRTPGVNIAGIEAAMPEAGAAVEPVKETRGCKKQYVYSCPRCGAEIKSKAAIKALCDCKDGEAPVEFACTFDPSAE